MSLMEFCYLYVEDFREKLVVGIINVGFIVFFIFVFYSLVYVVIKSFVLNFIEGLVGELFEMNIKVFCFCFGGIVSNFVMVVNEFGVDNF